MPKDESEHLSELFLKKEIGDRLRRMREAIGHGLRPFARIHGLKHARISHWEKGRHYPDPIYVQLLWRRYQVTADFIYLREIAGLPSDLADRLRSALTAALIGHALHQPPARGEPVGAVERMAPGHHPL